MFDRKEEPARELMDLARNHTTGDVSARRHQASRARVIDRWTAPTHKARNIALAVIGSMAVSTAAFAELKHLNATAEADSISTTAKPFKPQPQQPQSVEQASPAMDPVAASEPLVSITVEPDSAKVFWDGVQLEGSPATYNHLAAHSMHRIHVEAVGYQPKTMSVSVDEPKVSMHLKLVPMPVEISEVTTMAPFENVDEVLEGLRDRFTDCYTEGLAQDPTITGFALLSLLVNAEGHVVHSEIAQSTGLSPKVKTCLAYVGSDAAFSEGATKNTALVRIPLTFGMKDPVKE